jgi:hypothetical protein
MPGPLHLAQEDLGRLLVQAADQVTRHVMDFERHPGLGMVFDSMLYRILISIQTDFLT